MIGCLVPTYLPNTFRLIRVLIQNYKIPVQRHTIILYYNFYKFKTLSTRQGMVGRVRFL